MGINPIHYLKLNINFKTIMKKLTLRQKGTLKLNLMKIEQYELICIFNILKEKNVKFTKNKSGIYFREDHIDDETLSFINEYVNKKLKDHALYHSGVKNESNN